MDDCTYRMVVSASNTMLIDNRSAHGVCMHAMLDLIEPATASCGFIIAKQKHTQTSRKQNRNRQQQSVT